jgi:hypothetical protein
MPDNSTYSQPPAHNKFTLEAQRLNLDAGLLGKCFGSKINAPVNIAGFFVVVLALSGISALFFSSAIPAGEY